MIKPKTNTTRLQLPVANTGTEPANAETGTLSYAEDSEKVRVKVSAGWADVGGSGSLTGITAGPGISVTGSATAPTVTNTGVRTLTAGSNVTIGGTSTNPTISASVSSLPAILTQGYSWSANEASLFTNTLQICDFRPLNRITDNSIFTIVGSDGAQGKIYVQNDGGSHELAFLSSGRTLHQFPETLAPGNGADQITEYLYHLFTDATGEPCLSVIMFRLSFAFA